MSYRSDQNRCTLSLLCRTVWFLGGILAECHCLKQGDNKQDVLLWAGKLAHLSNNATNKRKKKNQNIQNQYWIFWMIMELCTAGADIMSEASGQTVGSPGLD